jgi:hypothetical protein
MRHADKGPGAKEPIPEIDIYLGILVQVRNVKFVFAVVSNLSRYICMILRDSN